MINNLEQKEQDNSSPFNGKVGKIHVFLLLFLSLLFYFHSWVLQ